MNPTFRITQPPARRVRRPGGFTLIETMVTVAVAGVLSSVAYPSLEGQVMRARRSDALVALMQAQLAEERFRANNASYGSLADAGVRPTSPAGHYRVQVVSSDAGDRGSSLQNFRDARCASSSKRPRIVGRRNSFRYSINCVFRSVESI